jgi:hypothetical protein
MLIVLGLLIVAAGAAWLFAPSAPWLGRLPGDIVIERPNSRFYFPVMTCILLSLLLSAMMWIVRQFQR